MRKLLGLAVAGILASAVSMSPATATAATEFGDACTADQEYSGPVTFFEASAAGNPLPLAAPSSGVLTKWKVSVIPVPFTFPQTLKVLRLNTASHTASVIGETAATIGSGQTVIDARIPVQAGDRLSIFGGGFIATLTCTTLGQENLIGGFEGNGGGVGSSSSYIELPEEFRIPVAAVIEPDADGDGYGDETQDNCPQSAATQGKCPKVKIDIGSALKKKGSVVVALTTSSAAPVKVTGTVKLGKGKTAKLSGGKHTVKPGKITRFTLEFTGKLKAALADLPHSQSLSLKVTASAKDLIGRIAKDQVKVKLKGQA